LFAHVDESGPDLPQYAGRTLPKIKEGDFSVCYVSKKAAPPPDTVVMTDATHSELRKVVRREYAVPHPNDPGNLPGFEPRLLLKRRAK
jgi:hypothetical protein